ncbi:MAG: hypothetical protein JXQ80_12855 [Bacteroidales bacterium]|nr:hypothetical protein [Bacteroidales bacterium]
MKDYLPGTPIRIACRSALPGACGHERVAIKSNLIMVLETVCAGNSGTAVRTDRIRQPLCDPG